MAKIINMPRLSDTMEEGVVATWLKKIGDKVVEGDILAEIETDKATMEFESFYEGVLLHIGIAEGDSAPVDALLAIIGEEGEDITALLNTENKSTQTQTTKAIEEVAEQEQKEATTLPEGVAIVTMPRLSDTMEEGTVASWLKQIGDTVEEGDILAEIETDKATMEFESFYSGKLLYIGLQEGESAKVDSILAVIGPEGTSVESILASKTNKITPNVTVAPKITEETTPTTATKTDKRILASPLAKKIAASKNINLHTIKGSGENGRIIKKDIENYTAPTTIDQQESSNISKIHPMMLGKEDISKEITNSPMRKAIARSLGKSKFSAPHFYLTIEIDMDNAITCRKQINNLPDTKISFNDMIVKSCAMALKKHPKVNTSWTETATIYKENIHIGVAVAVEDGLVVPTLKFTDQLSLTQIGEAVKALAEKARSKKIKPEEMEGSTFTVSNLGMFGITEFTSIINQPNSAILSVGAIVQKPVVKNNQIVIGNILKVTLACDHRTVDGAVGAQFLQTLKSYLENPVIMLA